jgi:predicted double-glycine peptidase
MNGLTIPLAVLMLALQPSETGIYLDVPFVHQSPRQCGPAALAMSLRYWGYDVDHTALAARTVSSAGGATGSDLEQLARAHGSTPRAFTGTDDRLRQLLRSGRPVIVALAAASGTAPNHFVLVVGATTTEWLVHDPAGGPYRRIEMAAFAGRWKRLNNWALLVERDRTTTAAPAVATEPPNSTAAAEPFWERASVYFRQQRYREARDVVRQGLALAPGDAYGHDFLATLLQIDGRTVEALHHWNVAGAPVLRKIHYRLPEGASAEPLSRLYRLNEGETLTRARWIDAAWLQRQLLPRQHVRWRLVPGAAGADDQHEWSLEIDVADPPLRSWKAQGARNAVTAALDRELSFDVVDTAASRASVAARWDPARQRLRADWQRLFVNGPSDRLRLAVDLRDEAWVMDPAREVARLQSGELGLAYDHFLASRRSVSARLAYLRHASTSFVVSGLTWQQTVGLDTADRVRLQWTAQVDAFARAGTRARGAQRGLVTAGLRWSVEDDASTTAGVRLNAGAIRGELPIDRQFVFGGGPDAPLLLRAHPTLRDGMNGGGPVGTRFGLLNADVERRLTRVGWVDVRGVVFADYAAVGRQTYTDAGGGIRLRAVDQTIDILVGRDFRGRTTRVWAGLSCGL